MWSSGGWRCWCSPLISSEAELELQRMVLGSWTEKPARILPVAAGSSGQPFGSFGPGFWLVLKAKITMISLQVKLPRVLHWPLRSIPQQESALKALLRAGLASAQKPLLDPESHLPTCPSCESPEQLPMGPVCPWDRRRTLLPDLHSSRVPARGFTEPSCSGSLHRLTNPHHWPSHSSWVSSNHPGTSLRSTALRAPQWRTPSPDRHPHLPPA